jgi:hypothetical protein
MRWRGNAQSLDLTARNQALDLPRDDLVQLAPA